MREEWRGTGTLVWVLHRAWKGVFGTEFYCVSKVAISSIVYVHFSEIYRNP